MSRSMFGEAFASRQLFCERTHTRPKDAIAGIHQLTSRLWLIFLAQKRRPDGDDGRGEAPGRPDDHRAVKCQQEVMSEGELGE